MTNRTVVIRRRSFGWQPNTKRKIKIKPVAAIRSHAAGYISPVFIVLACALFSGLFYIYSVNQTAVKGIEIRKAEKEIAQQQQNNETLKIKEAELKSLYHIEEQSKQLNMAPAANVKYIEESPSVAFGTAAKGGSN
jgi:cell division protein FtsL